MQREIKFRAYIKKDYNKELIGKMIEVSSIHLKKKKVIIGYSLSRSNYGNRSYLYDDIELMQYTGLKDKNGKEIYEGDIVKANFFEKHIIGKIEFALGAFFVTGSAVSDNQMFVFNDLEVIGNIYENSNLLEE